MATATLVFSGAHRLRYLVAAEGTGAETVNITTVGTATPDTLTDSLQGSIKKISKVVADGYGQFAAGAQTQAKARALWLSDVGGANPDTSPALPGPDVAAPEIPLARCHVTARSGNATTVITVDADVSGGNPIVVCAITGGGAFYLDVETPNTIGA